MSLDYISNVEPFKCGVIFTYIHDLERLYKLYKDTFYRNPSIKDFAITQMIKTFHYLKGYMTGLGVNHKSFVSFKDDVRYECLTFYNNPSCTVKYSIFVNFDYNTFRFSYIRKEKK